jgi:hypothetical protein
MLPGQSSHLRIRPPASELSRQGEESTRLHHAHTAQAARPQPARYEDGQGGGANAKGRYEPRQRVPGEPGGLTLVRSILRLPGVRVLLAAWLLGALLLAAIFGVYGGMQVHLPAGVDQDGDLLVWIRAAGLLGVLAVPAVLWKLGGRDPMGLIVAGVVVCVLGLLAQTLPKGRWPSAWAVWPSPGGAR